MGCKEVAISHHCIPLLQGLSRLCKPLSLSLQQHRPSLGQPGRRRLGLAAYCVAMDAATATQAPPEAAAEQKFLRLPKRKVALHVGYVGTEFRGTHIWRGGSVWVVLNEQCSKQAQKGKHYTIPKTVEQVACACGRGSQWTRSLCCSIPLCNQQRLHDQGINVYFRRP